MSQLLPFAPFIVFAVLARLLGPAGALVAGAITSAVLLARDRATSGRPPKILEVGTALLFSGLALVTVLAGLAWSIVGVRLCADAGLLLIVLVSIALRRPFTLQYAREQVDPALWEQPRFIRTNYVLTTVWALAFAAMVLAELALLYVPGLPQGVGIGVVVLALAGAFVFSRWYPARVRARRGA